MRKGLGFLIVGGVAALIALTAGIVASDDDLKLSPINDIARVVYAVAYLVAALSLIVWLAIVVYRLQSD
ncbi:hypothetical protein ABN034_10160 [Actinopolymorpha sp. B11F2]|uniref:hypothetical protein n=1 Tax=Actinopolymorpha sp. B11F2 TaxID=3160862 RepID=UPI0032E489D4